MKCNCLLLDEASYVKNRVFIFFFGHWSLSVKGPGRTFGMVKFEWFHLIDGNWFYQRACVGGSDLVVSWSGTLEH